MTRARRAIWLACALALCSLPAWAEPLACECGEVPCVCFIQAGDGGIAVAGVIQRLKARGYLPQDCQEGAFDAAAEAALLAFQADNGLEQTGAMDDETLTRLIWDMSVSELDEADTSSNGGAVYVPTDGGKRRHGKRDCSGMLHPRLVSVRNADALGLQPCGRCKPQ